MKKIIFVGLIILAFSFAAAAQEKTVTVDLGSYYVHPVTVKNTTALRGKFYTLGGANKHVEVLIMTAENLEKRKNDQTALFLYQSGNSTGKSFIVRVRPGTYFMVINNKSAAPEAEVKLTIY